MFNIKTAIKEVKHAQLAYADYSELEDNLRELDISNYIWYDKDDTQGILTWKDKKANLSFRGTEPTNLLDWITDMKITMADTPFGEIHDGVWNALKPVWDNKIQKDLTKLAQTGEIESISIEGHSLGGGLTTACAFLVYAMGIKIDDIYTFGSLRTLSVKAVAAYNRILQDRTCRIVNCNDRIPGFPLAFRFHHVRNLIEINSDGKIELKERTKWDRWKDRAVGRLKQVCHLNLLPGITDHDLEEYVRLLEANFRDQDCNKEV